LHCATRICCAENLSPSTEDGCLLGAIEEYELEMMRYAFEAITASSQAMNQFVAPGAGRRRVAKLAMRVLNRVPRHIKYKMLAHT
jgi:hypothetical protein